MSDKHVVVLSGGLDSSTLLAYVDQYRPDADEIHCISFDYGQRHAKELEFAVYQAQDVGASHKIVDVTFLRNLFVASNSSLVTGTDVPEGHYGEESMKATVVPNRNMIMASIAAGYAVSIGAVSLWMGVHAGDHFIYPDCRPRFFNALNAAVVLGNEGFGAIEKTPENAYPQTFISTPFINMTKNNIASLAFELQVDVANTWSCYKGEELHCGRCGTCVERLEAIASTGRPDPTSYQDDQFWKDALKRETV